jgi:hypothetical protein
MARCAVRSSQRNDPTFKSVFIRIQPLPSLLASARLAVV